MSPRLRIGIGVLLALLLGWYLSGFERVTVKQHVGYSGEARLRPFLAAERFAERMGLATRELRLDLPARLRLVGWSRRAGCRRDRLLFFR